VSFELESLYALLPEVYRTRDAAIAEARDDLLTPAEAARLDELREALAAGGGLDPTGQRDLARLEEKRTRGPLKSLLAVIAEQAVALEEGIEQLYDDHFIETCADWAVPYVADLVGYRALDPELQRRLGSGRAEVANTIRLRRRKGTAAALEELALGITGWDAAVVELFQRLATTQHPNHVRVDTPATVDVRQGAQPELAGSAFDPHLRTADVRRTDGAARPNIPNVAIFLWPVGSRRLTSSPAFRVDGTRFRFDPLGRDVRLYGAAERETDVTRLAEPLDVPMPITRRALRAQLDELYGPGRSLSIQRGDTLLEPDEVEACDLSDHEGGWAHPDQERVAIDPVLGRIAFPDAVAEPVLVTYHYGSAADIGGGEYDRTPAEGVPGALERAVPRDRETLTEALADLGGAGVVEITGSGAFEEAPAIEVGEDTLLTVRAATGSRPLLRLTGDLVVGGGDSGEVTLDGLLVAGGRIVVPEEIGGQPNRLQRLRLVHCTLVPGAAESIEVAAEGVTVELERSIVGPLRIAEGSQASAAHSIVDAGGPAEVALEAPGGGATGPLALDSCTVIGKLHAARLEASDSILHAARGEGDPWPAAIVVERGQSGYVRYSYAPLDSQLPPRFECRPRGGAETGMEPRFHSTRYGAVDYCRLHGACPREISCGASDGGEMGVHHDLYAPQRVAGLRVRLDEYLRFGLEAGLIFATDETENL
jgi:Phage tail protein (Tail_P2_I)